MDEKRHIIGLDLGTNSIGWAVVGETVDNERYKFLSKSQLNVEECWQEMDVVYLAKVQISKQITTKGISLTGNL